MSHSNFSIADIPAYLVVAHLDLARDSLLRFGAVALDDDAPLADAAGGLAGGAVDGFADLQAGRGFLAGDDGGSGGVCAVDLDAHAGGGALVVLRRAVDPGGGLAAAALDDTGDGEIGRASCRERV